MYKQTVSACNVILFVMFVGCRKPFSSFYQGIKPSSIVKKVVCYPILSMKKFNIIKFVNCFRANIFGELIIFFGQYEHQQYRLFRKAAKLPIINRDDLCIKGYPIVFHILVTVGKIYRPDNRRVKI